MRHLSKILILIIIIQFSTSDDYNTLAELNVGDSFIYEITKANHSFEFGGLKFANDGYAFGSQNLPVSSLVNVTVDYFSGGGVMFRLNANNTSRVAFISTDWLDFFGLCYSYNILYHIYEIFFNYHHGYLLDLYLYQILPYLKPAYNSYLLSPETLGEDIESSFKNNYLYPDIECSYFTSTKNGEVYFESWIGGKIDTQFGSIVNEVDDRDNYPTDVEFGINFHYCIDNNTGIVLGVGRRGWVEGQIDEIEVKASMDIEYELQGYDFPKYRYGNEDFSMFFYLLIILIPTISIIYLLSVTIALVIRKSRINKLSLINED